METCPEDRIEEMVDDFDSEAFDECEWLDEDDDHLRDSQATYLQECLGGIKDALHVSSNQRTVAKRRRSISPDRRSRPRRNYKVLPLSEEGDVELPLVLGRGTNRTIVTNVGRVEDAPNFRQGKYVFPVGFESKRKYFSLPSEKADPGKSRKSYYFCLIGKSADRPRVPLPSHTGLLLLIISGCCSLKSTAAVWRTSRPRWR